MLGLPGSAFLRLAADAGLRPVREAFADRAYNPDGTLVSRRLPGSVLHDPDAVAARMVRLAQEGVMTASTLQNARELAQLNIKTVHDLLTGAADEVNVDIGNPLITIDNAQEYIDLYREAGLITD